MSRNFLLILAIVSGILAASVAYVYFQKERERTMLLQKRLQQQQQQLKRLSYELEQVSAEKQVIKRVPVVVAKEDIKAGTILTSDLVEEKMVSLGSKLPASAGSLEAVVGKLVTVDLVKGEQILLSRLRSPDVLRQQVIPLGKRLVTIQVQQLELFKFIHPGDKVDIALMFTLPPSQIVTAGLFSNVEVKAVNGLFYSSKKTSGKLRKMHSPIEKRGTKIEEPMVTSSPNQGTLTFALAPKDAAILLMASQLGSIKIFPRSQLDADNARLPAVTVDAVLQYAIPDLLKQAREMARIKEENEKKKEEQLGFVGGLTSQIPAKRVKIRKGNIIEIKQIPLNDQVGTVTKFTPSSLPEAEEGENIAEQVLSMFRKSLISSEGDLMKQTRREDGIEELPDEEKTILESNNEGNFVKERDDVEEDLYGAPRALER